MDLGTIANATPAARSAGVADVRVDVRGDARVDARVDVHGGGERIALSPRLLLPLLQQHAAGNAALAALARDVGAQSGSAQTAVTLVLPAAATATSAAQAAHLEIGGKQLAVSPALRDALLAQAPGAASPVSDGAARGAGAAMQVLVDEAARAWVVSAQTQAATSQLMAGQVALAAGAGREVLRAAAPNATAATREQALASVGFDQPMADGAALETAPVSAVSAIAQRLQQQFERSGLFFEAHVAQWTRDARDTDELRAELVQLNRGGQALGEAGAQRVAAQLSVLQEQAVALTGPAWPGQPMRLLIEREPRQPMAADAETALPPVIAARLALDLPRLGPVEVDLKLAGKAIATVVRSASTAAMAAALVELTDQLSARGLTPVAAQAVPLDNGGEMTA